jgi:hypothetical protein
MPLSLRNLQKRWKPDKEPSQTSFVTFPCHVIDTLANDGLLMDTPAILVLP